MAETLTDSSGVVYKRPLLASEFSATPGKSLTIANGYYDKGETWGMITVDKTGTAPAALRAQLSAHRQQPPDAVQYGLITPCAAVTAGR